MKIFNKRTWLWKSMDESQDEDITSDWAWDFFIKQNDLTQQSETWQIWVASSVWIKYRGVREGDDKFPVLLRPRVNLSVQEAWDKVALDVRAAWISANRAGHTRSPQWSRAAADIRVRGRARDTVIITRIIPLSSPLVGGHMTWRLPLSPPAAAPARWPKAAAAVAATTSRRRRRGR